MFDDTTSAFSSPAVSRKKITAASPVPRPTSSDPCRRPCSCAGAHKPRGRPGGFAGPQKLTLY
ncbi:hypothetical protein H2LOC_005845 [Methylocystis heyeri]|uniref:Uncharacterized protein n=1 Tax=Methylocystis heyeri TaxID=391905 RepID=A0A6B8KAC3_9HYPH|nr:hypothetical protein H2LOC_005845 [Methylocystis heyeri]